MAIKEKYQALKTKLTLPDYEEINKEFQIEEITEETALLLKIRLKMQEKLEHYASIMEGIIQPDTILKDMYEAKYISDNARADAYLLFKRLLRLIRYSELVNISNANADNAKFITDSLQGWTDMKDDLAKHLSRLKNLWEKETDIKEDMSYFG
ncbi:MAG: hypothetical protein ABIJ34_07070 [archaeon]